MKRGSPLLWTYRLGVTLMTPAASGLLLWRRGKGKEDPTRLGERRGHAGRARPAGPLVWLHGASVGETLSILPLVERLTRRGVTVLVTSGTRTSAQLVARRLPPGAIHQFMPLDVPLYIKRFLDHWRPDLALFAESELWPNFVHALDRRGVPLVLINARLSERSFRRWMRVPQAAEAMLSRFAFCLAQSPGDAERLQRLGAPRVSIAGNLKFDSPAPPADPRTVASLQALTAGRPVWMAASTHPGEEEAAIAVHRALAKRYPDLLTIVAPRHPQRGPDIAAMAQESGLVAVRRAEGMQPDRAVDFYVADTIGELGLFYRLVPLVFVGGSLVPHGGQNPIEPAKLGAAILHGPHVHNFTDVYAAIDRARGALPVNDARALAQALADLLSDPGRMRTMGRAGTAAVEGLGGALERTIRAIDPFLVGLRASGPG
ncbi:3-deoxy-D-manno-octulosonic acid transferase [Salinarimonas sp.]|uniref:3-deoxy-D-manno-octulosonic acid transferase n=1 Tax=Salinarimonas sp. TaxID=2766526 RepID=UPI0032D8F022